MATTDGDEASIFQVWQPLYEIFDFREYAKKKRKLLLAVNVAVWKPNSFCLIKEKHANVSYICFSWYTVYGWTDQKWCGLCKTDA